ncbi:tyrosine-protein kinase BAZ1B-like isoform X2 [Montipora foliosa]|uniref:tyrosine-protein kinase BAZ1B-like isoform X2 n=1 Tax=Montipora foliosa TaxID=591990 RepID=UPI0035F1225D
MKVWSCQFTGRTNLKYAEAVESENQALESLQSFPKYFEKPVLQIVHHGSEGLQALGEKCSKHLENKYFEDEPVEYRVGGQWLQGKISRVHHKNKDDMGYEITCEETTDIRKNVLKEEIKRVKKLPSVEMLKCFIRAKSENPWSNDHSPWVVKADLVKKYSLTDKLNDFFLSFNKKTTPKSKKPVKTMASSEKGEKKVLDERTGHGNPKVNKKEPSQKKLESFTKGSVKHVLDSFDQQTPSEKDVKRAPSICMGKGYDQTPSGKLQGTPVKCRLVLTPVKSPCTTSRKSPEQKISITKKKVPIRKEITVILDDSRQQKSVEKQSKSSKNLILKSKKSLEGKWGKDEDILSKDKASTKHSAPLVVIDGGRMENDRCVMKIGSSREGKSGKEQTSQWTDLIVQDDADDVFETFPKKKRVTTSKMKQTTLLDLSKKCEEDVNDKTSPKMKSKKQKTLSEMFGISLQKDKPNAVNALMGTTAQVVSSPRSLALNSLTLQQEHLAEKFISEKENLKWQSNGRLGQKCVPKQDDDDLLILKPLPAKAINLPSGITFETYSDVIMVAEFVNLFRDLLSPKETLHISIANLSDALITGPKGFSLLSKILVVFLQILLQDSSTEGEELGLHLSEVPLTRQTASEVSRLYLSNKMKGSGAYEEYKEVQGTLESLQHQEFYTLTAAQKIKVMVTLCHEVLSSDAFHDYKLRQSAEAAELRKEKMAKQKEKKEQQREEKERLRKEEEKSRKQLTMDDLSKKDGSGINPDAVSMAPALEGTSNTSGQKTEKESAQNVDSRKYNAEDISDRVNAMKKRREEMENKQENKMKEEKQRLEKEEEEQWNLNMTHCMHTKRLKPIGYDRNHARYWVFDGIGGGVFVEQGWRNLEDLSKPSDESSKDVLANNEAMKTEQAPFDCVEETKDVGLMVTCPKDEIQEPRLTDVPYSWSCYETEEEVQELVRCLSWRVNGERALKKTLKEQMESIVEGIRNANKKPTKLQTDENDFCSSVRQELKDMAERLVYGNLAILSDGLEHYQQAVDAAVSVKDLASELEKLLPSLLPQFCQGTFSKDNAKQRWLEEVKQASTVSRLHLLLSILDSTVIWDLSAENARCKICRLKGIGTTLILCDDCNLAYHLQCLRPALSEVPEGHWSCPVCKPSDRHSSRTCVKNYKESQNESGNDEDSEASSSGDESDGHEDFCDMCGEDGDLICCDSCPLVFHTTCHLPPLRNIPRGAWSCWKCRQPKNKKQNKDLQGGGSTKTKGPKKNSKTLTRRDNSPPRKSKRKRSRSVSSEESVNQKVSKQSQRAENETAHDQRHRARPSIESIVGEKVSKKQASTQKDTVLSKLRRRYPRDSASNDEISNTNIQSFYGRSTRSTRQRKVCDHKNNSDEQSDNQEVAGFKKTRNRPGYECRRSRRGQITGDPGNEDEDNKMEGKENRPTSRRKKSGLAKTEEQSTRRSTRNQRRASGASEESDDDEESELSSLDESVDSGPTIPREGISKRSPLRDRLLEANKPRGKGKIPEGLTNKKSVSSVVKDRQAKTQNFTRHCVQHEEKKEKRRRVNAEMASCEQILKTLMLHKDSWPFRQAVNLREVPDYLELVKTPMDLGTMREKLNSAEYPDAESFVADVRLVFSNSDKYNLDTSEVGKAGKSLEKFFDQLFEDSFFHNDQKSKNQRKR